ADFSIESLGLSKTPELESISRGEVERLHREKNQWVLIDGERLVSYSGLNARLPDVVQVGGVWTPPDLRGRGYGRCAVAGSLLAVFRPSVPVDEHVHSDEGTLGSVPLAKAGLERRRRRARVDGGLQLTGLLAEPLDDGLRELPRPDLRRARAFRVDVIGVDSVLDRLQPRVVHARGDLGLADVNEHHHRREQQAGRVGDVLSRAPRRGTVDRLEHRAAIANVRRSGQADGAGD